MVQFVWDLRKWKLICKTCRKFGGADTSISNVSWKKELHINLKYMLPKVPVSWETLFSFHNFWSLLSTWNLFFFNILTLGPGPAEFLAAQDTFRRVFRVTFWLCRNLLIRYNCNQHYFYKLIYRIDSPRHSFLSFDFVPSVPPYELSIRRVSSFLSYITVDFF